jgi:DNA ligase-1
MSSPAKKRKLNSDGKQKPTPAKGLEYFFAKQRQNGSSSNTPSSHEAQDGTAQSEHADGSLTDEELAKKLQAEWDAEVRGSSSRSSPRPEPDEAGADAGTPASRKTHTPLDPGLPPSGRVLQSAKVKNTLSLSSAAATEDEITASLPLNESPLVFEPSKYITQLQSSWAAEGGDASYALLTRCFVLVNGTQSRIKIVDTLVNCIRLLIEGDPASLLPAVWLATNAISPPYISMELGLGGSAISKALKQACGLDSRALKALYEFYFAKAEATIHQGCLPVSGQNFTGSGAGQRRHQAADRGQAVAGFPRRRREPVHCPDTVPTCKVPQTFGDHR